LSSWQEEKLERETMRRTTMRRTRGEGETTPLFRCKMKTSKTM